MVRLGTRVTDQNGADLNAVTASVVLTLPDDTSTTLDVLNPPAVVGHYLLDYVPAVPGTYTYRWVFTQPAVSYESGFYVSRPGAVGLLSLAEGKDLLKIPDTDTRHDADVAETIVRATDLAETTIGEVLVRRTVTETLQLYGWNDGVRLTYRPVAHPILLQRLNPDQSVIEEVGPPAIWTDEFSILRAARPAALWGLIRVTYVAGPDVVPESKRGGVEYLVQHLWANRGGATARPRVGGTSAGEAPTDPEDRTAIPTRAREQLGPKAPLVG